MNDLDTKETHFQIICGPGNYIHDVDARFPGSTHDSYIAKRSAAIEQLLTMQEYKVLGDSGYPCKPALLTPLPDARTAQEQRYNTAHKRTRSAVERTIGVLKSRFRYVSIY